MSKYRNLIIGGLISLVVGVSSQFVKHGYISKLMANFRDEQIAYSNEEFGFSIQLPTDPIIEKQQVAIDSLTKINITTIHSKGADKSEYAVVVTEYPKGLLNESLPYENLHRGINASMKDSNFEIINTIDTLVNDVPAVFVKSQSLSDSKYRRYMMVTMNGNKSIGLLGDLRYFPTQLSHFQTYFNSFQVAER